MTSAVRRVARTAKTLTVTGRAASSTVSPSRTRLYARSPSTLIALTEDGTWEMSPVSAETADRMAASSTWPAGVVDTGSPSASSVTVVTPSWMVAS